jgi:hypothetical protein
MKADVFEITLMREECIACGVVFAIPAHLQKRLQESHKSFCCPNGHSQYYKSESDADRYKRRMEWAENQRDQARQERDRAEASRRAHKAAHTRTKNRIQNGVCPHCKRYFENIHRHMETKHHE